MTPSVRRKPESKALTAPKLSMMENERIQNKANTRRAAGVFHSDRALAV